MTDLYAANDQHVTVEFHDLVLVSSGYAGNVYDCSVNGVPLRFHTDANPTGSILIDAALNGYKALLMAEHSRSVTRDIDRDGV